MEYSSTRLLLVDSRPESLFSFAGRLAGADCRVATASGVDQAISIAERATFEMVVCRLPLDFTNPGMLVRFLRRMKRHRRVRLVVVDPCQSVGVRLTKLNGEPVYSLRPELPTGVVASVIKYALALPISSGDYPPGSMPVDHGQSAPAPHFTKGQVRATMEQ